MITFTLTQEVLDDLKVKFPDAYKQFKKVPLGTQFQARPLTRELAKESGKRYAKNKYLVEQC